MAEPVRGGPTRRRRRREERQAMVHAIGYDPRAATSVPVGARDDDQRVRVAEEPRGRGELVLSSVAGVQERRQDEKYGRRARRATRRAA
jgi:hypothetical protein